MANDRFLERKFQTTSRSTQPRVRPSHGGVKPRSQAYLIEKCVKQLVKKGLFGRPYVQDFLYEQKRRNCRPSTIRSNFTTLMVFLSYLKERGRTSLETITRDDLSSFIEHEQDRGMQPNTVSTRLRHLYAFLRYLVDREVAHPDLLETEAAGQGAGGPAPGLGSGGCPATPGRY